MTREIKFRALVEIPGGRKWFWYCTGERYPWESVIEFKVIVKDLQSTGLLDKNGREIYEGDIFSFGDCVSWGDGFWKVGKSIKVGAENGDFSTVLGSRNSKDWEIIGNIYENPELLK